MRAAYTPCARCPAGVGPAGRKVDGGGRPATRTYVPLRWPRLGCAQPCPRCVSARKRRSPCEWRPRHPTGYRAHGVHRPHLRTCAGCTPFVASSVCRARWQPALFDQATKDRGCHLAARLPLAPVRTCASRTPGARGQPGLRAAAALIIARRGCPSPRRPHVVSMAELQQDQINRRSVVPHRNRSGVHLDRREPHPGCRSCAPMISATAQVAR